MQVLRSYVTGVNRQAAVKRHDESDYDEIKQARSFDKFLHPHVTTKTF